MRRILPVVAFATLSVGCGRIGYTLLPGGAESDAAVLDGSRLRDGSQADSGVANEWLIPDDAVYISPSGDDGNAGNADAPWRTWSSALAQLRPGDWLVAKDGEYTTSTGTGPLQIHCGDGSTTCDGAPCPNGTATDPITVIAENERRAFLHWEVGDSAAPFKIRDCTGWRFRGLRTENADDPAAPIDTGDGVTVRDSSDVVLSRILTARTNRYQNTTSVSIHGSKRVLVEESEAYWFHSEAFSAYRSEQVVFRRNYANTRLHARVPGGWDLQCYYAPFDADSTGFSSSAKDIIFENNVAETICRGFQVTLSAGLGADILLAGNVALGPMLYGVISASVCGGANPCTYGIIRNLRVVDQVVAGSEYGVRFRGLGDGTVSHSSFFDALHTGVRFDLFTGNAALAATAYADHVAVSGSGRFGIDVDDQADWSVTNSNVFGPTTPYDPATTEPTNLTIDPGFGACRVYVPPGAPLKGAGQDGTDIGANVVFRTVDGVVTSQKLWNPTTGAFPCGAQVTGVNDAASFPDSSCITVHQRLGVGGSCPIP